VKAIDVLELIEKSSVIISIIAQITLLLAISSCVAAKNILPL